MLVRIAILATGILFAGAHPSAASDIEGRWIRDCGRGEYCRVHIEKTGASSYSISFMHTQPSGKGTILDTGSEPDPLICGWDDTLAADGADGVSQSGLTASLTAGGKLELSGISAKCREPGKSATFDRDDADELGDI